MRCYFPQDTKGWLQRCQPPPGPHPGRAERQIWRKSAALVESGPGRLWSVVPFALQVEHRGPTAVVLVHLVNGHLRFMYMMLLSISCGVSECRQSLLRNVSLPE